MAGIISGLLALTLGAAFLLYGYRLFLVLLPIFGFFAGLWFCWTGVTLIFGDGFVSTIMGILIGIGGGIIGAVLSYLFYMVGVVFVSSAFGASLAVGVMSWLGIEAGWLIAIIAIAVAIVIAAIVVFFNIQRYVITLITSIGGANGLIAGILLVFNRITTEDINQAGNIVSPVLGNSWFWSLVWLALIVAGMFFQIRAHRNFVFSYERYQEGWG